jgi:hypothetical protein
MAEEGKKSGEQEGLSWKEVLLHVSISADNASESKGRGEDGGGKGGGCGGIED